MSTNTISVGNWVYGTSGQIHRDLNDAATLAAGGLDRGAGPRFDADIWMESAFVLAWAGIGLGSHIRGETADEASAHSFGIAEMVAATMYGDKKTVNATTLDSARARFNAWDPIEVDPVLLGTVGFRGVVPSDNPWACVYELSGSFMADRDTAAGYPYPRQPRMLPLESSYPRGNGGAVLVDPHQELGRTTLVAERGGNLVLISYDRAWHAIKMLGPMVRAGHIKWARASWPLRDLKLYGPLAVESLVSTNRLGPYTSAGRSAFAEYDGPPPR